MVDEVEKRRMRVERSIWECIAMALIEVYRR